MFGGFGMRLVGLGGAAAAVAPPGGGLVVPVLPGNALTYLDADAGPVGTPATAVGNPVTDWISLTDATGGSGPYDWTQTSSGDRGVLSNTTMTGGRLTVDFDGSTDHMTANALAPELDGQDTAFSVYLHCQVVGTPDNLDSFYALGNTGSTTANRHHSFYSANDFVIIRRGNSDGSHTTRTATNALAGVANTEITIVESFSAAQVKAYINNALVIDVALDVSSALFNLATLAARRVGGTLDRAAPLGVRRFGIWNVGLDSTQTATLYAQHGT